jgi:hypothetical protein
MPTKRESEGHYVVIFAFLYTALLMIALALTTYRELLETAYIWFIFSSVPLPVFVVLAEGDGILPTVFFTGICGLLDVVNLIIITVHWVQQGSFYLGLAGVSGGWFGLWALVLDLLVMIITDCFMIYFLLKSRKQANKYL